MRLASPETVLSVIGLPTTGTGGVKAAQDALDVSFPLLEQSTECRLSFSTITDTFILDGTPSPNLRLTSGFLASDKVTVTGADVFLVLRKEGVVILVGAPKGVVTVKYTCGYMAGSDKQAQNVDSALSSAHAHLAASLMQLSPAAVPKAKAQAMAVDAASGLSKRAYSILQGLHRPRALVVWPTHSKG